MSDTRTRSDFRPSELPPTLCTWCKHGLVVKEASPLYEDDEDFILKQHRAAIREVTFCRHPQIRPSPDEPALMEQVVMECQGYAARPIKVRPGACPERKAVRAARRKGRAGRGRRDRRG